MANNLQFDLAVKPDVTKLSLIQTEITKQLQNIQKKPWSLTIEANTKALQSQLSNIEKMFTQLGAKVNKVSLKEGLVAEAAILKKEFESAFKGIGKMAEPEAAHLLKVFQDRFAGLKTLVKDNKNLFKDDLFGSFRDALSKIGTAQSKISQTQISKSLLPEDLVDKAKTSYDKLQAGYVATTQKTSVSIISEFSKRVNAEEALGKREATTTEQLKKAEINAAKAAATLEIKLAKDVSQLKLTLQDKMKKAQESLVLSQPLSFSGITSSMLSSSKGLTSMFSGVGKAIQTVTTSVASLIYIFKSLGTAAINIGKTIIEPFKTAHKYVEDFNQTVIKITALTASFTIANGAKNMAAAYKDAKRYAGGVVEALFTMQKNTFATVEHLLLMTEELTKQGVFIDVNNKKQIEGFQNIANAVEVIAAGSIQKEIQVRQEVRALMLGQLRMNDQLAQQLDRILQGKGGLKANLKVWKEQGTVIAEIGSLLQGYGEATGDIQKTWMAIKNTLRSILMQIFRNGFTQAYTDINTKAKEFNELLTQNIDILSGELAQTWFVIKTNIDLVAEATRNWIKAMTGIEISPVEGIAKIMKIILDYFQELGTTAIPKFIRQLGEADKLAPKLKESLDTIKVKVEEILTLFKVFATVAVGVSIIKGIAAITASVIALKTALTGAAVAAGLISLPATAIAAGVTAVAAAGYYGYKQLNKKQKGMSISSTEPGYKPMSSQKDDEDWTGGSSNRRSELSGPFNTEYVPPTTEFNKSLERPAVITSLKKQFENLRKEAELTGKSLKDVLEGSTEVDFLTGKPVDELRGKLLELLKVVEEYSLDATNFLDNIKISLDTDVEAKQKKIAGWNEDIADLKENIKTLKTELDATLTLSGASSKETYLKQQELQIFNLKEMIKVTNELVNISQTDEKNEETLKNKVELEKQLAALTEDSDKNRLALRKADLSDIQKTIGATTTLMSLENQATLTLEEKKQQNVEIRQLRIKELALTDGLLPIQREAKRLEIDRKKALEDNVAVQEEYNKKIQIAQKELEILETIQAPDESISEKKKEINALTIEQIQLNTELGTSIQSLMIQALQAEDAFIALPKTFGDAFRKGMKSALIAMGDEKSRLVTMGNETATAMSSAFDTFFFDAFTGNLQKASDYFKAFLNDILKSISKMLSEQVTQNFLGMFAKGLGGGDSSATSTSSTSSITMPDRFVLSMPKKGHRGGVIKMHTGGMLRPDEIPFIGQTGEGILSRKGMQNLASLNINSVGQQKAPNIQFNIQNETGGDISAENTSVEFDFDKLVVNAVIKARNQSPDFRRAMNV